MSGFLRFLGGVSALSVMWMMGACAGEGVPLVAVEVSPLCAPVAPGGSQQFNATIFINSEVQAPDPDNAAVVWSVEGGDVNGTISNEAGSEGFYLAPDTVPPPAEGVTIIATSKEDNQKAGQGTAFLSGPCPEAPPFSIKF